MAQQLTFLLKLYMPALFLLGSVLFDEDESETEITQTAFLSFQMF
jgi:hypothetical protein